MKQDVEMLQLLDGSFVRPAAIGRADVAVNAVGGSANRLIYRPEGEEVVRVRNGMAGRACFGYYSSYSDIDDICGNGLYVSPHWLFYSPSFVSKPSPQAMQLSWTRKGAFARFTVPSGLGNLTSLDWLDVRVANDPNCDGARLRLLIIDKSGRNATLFTSLTIVNGWPGTNNLDRVHCMHARFEVVWRLRVIRLISIA